MVEVCLSYSKSDGFLMAKCSTLCACISWLYSPSREDEPQLMCIKAIWWHVDRGDLPSVGFLGLG